MTKEDTGSLKGKVVGKTAITKVDAEAGKLYYRGYDIEDLIEHSTFEEVFYLLVRGELPGPRTLTWFKNELLPWRDMIQCEKRDWERIRDHAYLNQPMMALSSMLTGRAVSVYRTEDAKNLPQRAVDIGMQLVPWVSTMAARIIASEHISRFVDSLPPKPHQELSHAANFLWMLRNGEYPTKPEERALDQAFILHADHEFNAGTYALRIAASTRAEPYACFSAGLAALSGPMHGGANEIAMKMFEDIKRPDRAAEWVVNEMINKQQPIFGFGHRLYRHRDPRSDILKKLAKEQCETKGLPWYDIASAVEQTTREILKSRGHAHDVPPNVDFWSPALFAALGIPAKFMPLVFAAARFAGWTAQLKEQYENNVLIRPNAEYIGPAPRPFPADRKND